MAGSEFKRIMNELGAQTAVLHTLSDSEREKLHVCLTQMLLDILKVCEKHGITMMLGHGSALGCVRHGGFIPWDDDLDLLMPRSDFEKFKKIFAGELSKDYELVSPNYQGRAKTRFPKVMKKNTTLRELSDIGSDLPCGVYIDIFVLENIPAGTIHRRIKGFLCDFLMLGSSCAHWYEHRSRLLREYMCVTTAGKAAYCLRMAAGFVFSVIPASKWFDWVDQAVRYPKETGILGAPTGRKHYLGEILPKPVFLPTVEGKFAGQTVPLPGDCDRYLGNLYGDYMEIPPAEKRERHLIVDFSLEG